LPPISKDYFSNLNLDMLNFLEGIASFLELNKKKYA